MIEKNSSILLVGHDDIIENSLFDYFQSAGYKNIFSSSLIGLDASIQPSVYHFFSKYRPAYVFLGSTRSGGIEANQKFAAEFIYHNLESQNNIIYSAQKFGVKKLIYFGSSCVYPKECPQPIKEEYLLTGELEKTSEPYAVSKIAGIKLCQSFKRQYGFNAIVMIPATIYGPGSDTDAPSAHVMGALIEKIEQAVREGQEEVSLWGTGRPRREFIYVEDFVQAALLLMDRYDGEEMINAGCGYDITIKDLAETVAEIIGFKGRIIFDPSRPDGARHKLLDNSWITKLGWEPRVPLREGIEKTYQWYKNKKSEKSGGEGV